MQLAKNGVLFALEFSFHPPDELLEQPQLRIRNQNIFASTDVTLSRAIELSLCLSLPSLFPEVSKLTIEVFCAFFREEYSRVLELNATFRSRNRVGQPVGPFHVEIDVVGSPNNARWCIQYLQLGFDRDGIFIIERIDESLEIAGTLIGGNEGTQKRLDGLVRYILRMLVGGP